MEKVILKDLFNVTKFGVQDARQIANKSKEFIKLKYGVNVKITKSSTNNWSGGKVSGCKQREITLNIISADRFDLLDFYNEIAECSFIYEENQGPKVWASSILNYIINLNVNGNPVEFGKIYRGKKINDDMVLRYCFNNEPYSETLNEYEF